MGDTIIRDLLLFGGGAGSILAATSMGKKNKSPAPLPSPERGFTPPTLPPTEGKPSPSYVRGEYLKKKRRTLATQRMANPDMETAKLGV